MKEYKRITAVVICAVMVVIALFIGLRPAPEENIVETTDNGDSLIIWYTDESMTDYLNSLAVEYHEKGGMRVLPRLHASSDFVESVYRASIEGQDVPDLYIVSNDTLEKAYLSGCAAIVDEKSEVLNAVTFPKLALDAVSYKGHRVAYPYYYETSALLYNKTYLHEMISNKLQAESVKEPEDHGGESVESDEEQETEVIPEAGTPEFEALVETKITEAIPKTFDELLSFADSYDAPEKVEGIFKWDVRDVFFNYFFIGNYINIGGACGDNIDSIDVYNLNAIRAMTVFQNLNSFFAFESSDVTYSQVVDEFIEGKLVFATATSDIVGKLEEAKAEGNFEYEYGLTVIPDLSEEMDTRSLSVTETVVVNGYSEKIDAAEEFARFMTVVKSGELYDRTGKLPAKNGASSADAYIDSKLKAFADEYSYSVAMPKLMVTSNYWLLLEDAFAGVWSGEDASGSLKKLAEQMELQITGQEVAKDYIELPKEEEEVEYLDEEALKQAAKEDEENEQ